MTDAKAIELALAETIRKYAEFGSETTIRAWHNMNFDGGLDSNPENGDRNFPLLDIRTTPHSTDDSQSTCFVDATLICATIIDDDRDHQVISAMYEAVQTLADKLFSQFRTGTDGEEITYFNGMIDTHTDNRIATFASMTINDPLPPYEEGGVNMIGFGIRMHYGRTDF